MVLAQIPEGLNWLLKVAEPLIVLAITLSIGYVLYWLVFPGETAAPSRISCNRDQTVKRQLEGGGDPVGCTLLQDDSHVWNRPRKRGE